jgi:hypothetical protein
VVCQDRRLARARPDRPHRRSGARGSAADRSRDPQRQGRRWSRAPCLPSATPYSSRRAEGRAERGRRAEDARKAGPRRIVLLTARGIAIDRDARADPRRAQCAAARPLDREGGELHAGRRAVRRRPARRWYRGPDGRTSLSVLSRLGRVVVGGLGVQDVAFNKTAVYQSVAAGSLAPQGQTTPVRLPP